MANKKWLNWCPWYTQDYQKSQFDQLGRHSKGLNWPNLLILICHRCFCSISVRNLEMLLKSNQILTDWSKIVWKFISKRIMLKSGLKIKDNIYLSLAWRTFWGKSDKMSIVDVQSVDKSTDQCSSVIVWKF